MGMQEHHGHAVARRLVRHAQRVVTPDAMFRTRATGIAALHMAMTKAGVETYAQGATIAQGCQCLDHGRRTDVGQHPIVTHDVQGVVPEDIRGEHDFGHRSIEGIASGTGAQDFVARHRIDPDLLGPHTCQHWRCRTGFHGIARLQARRGSEGANGVNSGL